MITTNVIAKPTPPRSASPARLTQLSAVSLYSVNDEGLIFEHAIDNRIKRDLWEYSHSWMGMLTGDRPPPLT